MYNTHIGLKPLAIDSEIKSSTSLSMAFLVACFLAFFAFLSTVANWFSYLTDNLSTVLSSFLQYPKILTLCTEYKFFLTLSHTISSIIGSNIGWGGYKLSRAWNIGWAQLLIDQNIGSARTVLTGLMMKSILVTVECWPKLVLLKRFRTYRKGWRVHYFHV